MTASTRSQAFKTIKSAVSQVARENNVPRLAYPADTETNPPPLPVDTAEIVTGSDVTVGEVGMVRRPKAVRKSNPAPVRRVAVDLPDYLVKAISKQAAEEGVTKRYLYLKAFRAANYVVHEVDMQEDGRRDD